ncbi:MAG: aminoacetone oxidase family FAD-binding enzyme [Clostridia bacterium]|nr:aminoacetone oxidase family FAD-binding enzyme [Clostridia bacterium]
MGQKIGIIGGGASGLMAACQLCKISEDKNISIELTILEKTSALGNKLLLTGHGRCNITNRQTARGSYKASQKLFYDASNFMSLLLNNYDSEDTISFVENTLGVKLKEEENGRMFPVSDKSSDIRDAMLTYIDRSKCEVRIITGFRAADIIQKEGSISVVSEEGMSMEFDDVILATGGASFTQTGSEGDGYSLLESLGHHIETPHAGLASIEVIDEDKEFTSSIAGVSVNARASLYVDRKIGSVDGDVLFTHKGISGPAVMELSRDIPRDIGYNEGWVELDFAPQYDDAEFDRDLLAEINSKPQTKIHNISTKYVPVSVSRALTMRADITDLTSRDMRKEDRRALVKEIKHLRLGIEKAPEMETAYVTVGGVDLKDVERKTMRSKKCPNLYIIGEVLNIDGKSGGFNLQACMSEAHAAASSLLG